MLGAQPGAGLDPEFTTCAEIKSQTLQRPNHLGALRYFEIKSGSGSWRGTEDRAMPGSTFQALESWGTLAPSPWATHGPPGGRQVFTSGQEVKGFMPGWVVDGIGPGVSRVTPSLPRAAALGGR